MPRSSTKTEPDHLWDALAEVTASLHEARKLSKDKHPILLFDLQEKFVYVYPYAPFRDELSEQGREMLREQYAEATRLDDAVVVFARDNERRELRSYIVDMSTDDDEAVEPPPAKAPPRRETGARTKGGPKAGNRGARRKRPA